MAAAHDLAPYTVLHPRFLGRPEPFLHYGLIAKEYSDTHEEFNFLLDSLAALDIIMPGSVRMPEAGRWRLRTKTGTLVDTWSAKDPERIRRVFLHGAIICEPGRVGFDAFTRVLGRLSQTGGWLTAAGTFEGNAGWLPEYWTLGQGENDMGVESFTIPSWENLYIYPGGRDDPKIKHLEAHYTPDRFLERCGARPAPPRGLVFHLFKVLKHVSVECEFNPELDVWLGVDPGRAHPYAIEVCQFTSDDTCQVFDEVYRTGLIDLHAIALCRQRPWWKNVKGVVMDIAGRQKTVHHERSSAEIWEHELGEGVPVYTNRVGVQDGISRMDTFLMPDPLSERPHLIVNPRCRGLICEMGGGPSPPEVDGVKAWVYPTDDDGNVIRDEPEDRHNDACNALAYLLVHKYGLVKPQKKSEPPPRRSAYGTWRGRPGYGTTVDGH